jgi:hypothetical protein
MRQPDRPSHARTGRTLGVFLPWAILEALEQRGRASHVAAELIAAGLGLELQRQRAPHGSGTRRSRKNLPPTT